MSSFKLTAIVLALCCIGWISSVQARYAPWTEQQILLCHSYARTPDDWLAARFDRLKGDMKQQIGALFSSDVKDILPTKYRKKLDTFRAGILVQANIEFNNRPDGVADIQLTLMGDHEKAFYTSSREARPANDPYQELYPDCPYKTDSFADGFKEIMARVEKTRVPQRV